MLLLRDQRLMKSVQRVLQVVLTVGIAIIGAYMTAVDPTRRVTGIIVIFAGIAIIGFVAYCLSGPKSS